jgi:hypothetical protein
VFIPTAGGRDERCRVCRRVSPRQAAGYSAKSFDKFSSVRRSAAAPFGVRHLKFLDAGKLNTGSER